MGEQKTISAILLLFSGANSFRGADYKLSRQGKCVRFNPTQQNYVFNTKDMQGLSV
jgi:hypothetical protein